MFLPSVPLRLFFGYAGFSFGSEGRLTRTINEDVHFPLVPLRFPFGYPSVMRVFYKFLKSDCWNLPRKAPEKSSRSGPKSSPSRPSPKAPKWPLGHKRLNDENFLRFSFGSPSVPRIYHFGELSTYLRTANGFNITCPKEWLPRPR